MERIRLLTLLLLLTALHVRHAWAALEAFEEAPRLPPAELAQQAFSKARNDPKGAIELAASVLDRTPVNQDVPARTLANRARMMAYFYQGMPGQAVSAGRDAITEATRNDDLKSRCDAQNDLARVFHSLDDVQRSIELILAVIEGRHELGDQKGVAAALNNLSIIYKNLDQFDHALRYAEQALEIKRELDIPKSLVASLTNTGNILLGLKRYPEALAFHEEALSIVENLGDDLTKGMIYSNVGRVHEAEGDDERAKQFYLLSSNTLAEENTPEQVVNLHHLALIHMRLGELNIARDYAQQALDRSLNLQQTRLVRQSYQTRALVEEAAGNYQLALADYRTYQEMQSQYLNEENASRVARAQALFDVEQQERTLALLQAENKLNAAKAANAARELEIQELENRRQLLWRNALIGFLVIFLVALILFWNTFSQRRKLEQERTLNERLQNLDRIKDEFLANTSHELRTPLQGIIGLSESLLERYTDELPADCRECLSMVVISGKRLERLVDDLLDFSKMKEHKLALNYGLVNLHALTELTFTLHQSFQNDRRVTLLNHVPPELEPVWADEARLQQVFHNLVGNALKFTDQGTIEVMAQKDDERILITIKDTGIGIPEDQQQQIFESFVQVKDPLHVNRGGTGLGLAVTQQLLKLHGSQLEMESQPGVGTTFTFEMPIAEQAHHDALAEQQQLEVQRIRNFLATQAESQPKQEKQKEPFHILVVDDEPINRQVMLHQLHEFHVHEASSGRQALDLFEKGQRFDLMLLDIMMPRLNGYEVCRSLREQFQAHELPIIILTAKTQVNDLREGFMAGANDFISKPFHREELISRIRTHLQLLKANRRLADYNQALQEDVAKRTEELEKSNLELRESQKQLMHMAHMEGLAEFAKSVLHSVGNELNSLTVSVQMMQELESTHTSLPLIQRISNTLQKKTAAIKQAQEIDPFIGKIPQALELLAEKQQTYQELLRTEWGQALETVETMRRIVDSQKRYASLATFTEEVSLPQIIDEVIEMKNHTFENQGIRVHFDFDQVPNVRTSRYKLFRVLTLIIDNACEALYRVERDQRQIWCSVFTSEDDTVTICIKDSGEGVPQEIATEIFRQGFTTKQNSTGLGLHYCATTMTELGGKLALSDDDEHRGAIFCLSLPLQSTVPAQEDNLVSSGEMTN